MVAKAKVSKDKKSKSFSVVATVSKATLEKLTSIAQHDRRTVSSVVRIFLEDATNTAPQA